MQARAYVDCSSGVNASPRLSRASNSAHAAGKATAAPGGVRSRGLPAFSWWRAGGGAGCWGTGDAGATATGWAGGAGGGTGAETSLGATGGGDVATDVVPRDGLVASQRAAAAAEVATAPVMRAITTSRPAGILRRGATGGAGETTSPRNEATESRAIGAGTGNETGPAARTVASSAGDAAEVWGEVTVGGPDGGRAGSESGAGAAPSAIAVAEAGRPVAAVLMTRAMRAGTSALLADPNGASAKAREATS